MSKNPQHDRVKTRGGGSRAVYTMCKKSSILVEDGFPKYMTNFEYRGEQAEMNIQRLNVRIDQVEEDLLGEKYKIKK